jgi:phosphatidylserine/phosphatidylglycerophosphate/cardiolipin synthase-like enzyme
VKRLFALMTALAATLALTTAVTLPSQASTGSGTKGGTSAAVAGKPKPKPWMPAQGAWFNTPRHGALQWVLHRHIVAGIEHAKPGSFIRIALFSFDRKYVASKLVNAKHRGVHVQVLLNDHQVTPAQKMLHRALGTDRTRKSFAYECSHGCRSRGENLHTKFYLFSHTGGARDTVMTGSVNLTGNSAMNQFNDLYVHNGSKRLHAAFVALFQQMRKDKPAHPMYWVQHVGKTYTLAATPYPRPGPHHDPIITILNNVHCKGATGPTGNKAHRTVIRVIMHAWNDYRGTYLAQKVRRLYAAGCDVKLMYGFAGADVRRTFATRTKRGFIPVHTTGFDTNEDGLIDKYTHQKELLISGHYGKNTHTRLVVTGSSNWNQDGARGDEEIFQIKNQSLAWHDYINDFVRMWTHRDFSSLVKYIPYPNAVTVDPIDPTDPTVPPDGRAMGRSSTMREPHGQVQQFTIAQTAKPGGPAWEDD